MSPKQAVFRAFSTNSETHDIGGGKERQPKASSAGEFARSFST